MGGSTSPSTSACDGACCGAFAASSSSFDAACNNLSAHPVLLHGCDTTAELHIRSTSHYVVRNCATAELHIRSTSHYIVRSCTTAELHIRSPSHDIVRSCACRKLRLCSASDYIIRSSGNVCIASCGRLRVLGASYHRNGCLEPSVRGALLEGHLFVRPVWPWTWIELSTSCVGVQIFAYHLMTSFNPC